MYPRLHVSLQQCTSALRCQRDPQATAEAKPHTSGAPAPHSQPALHCTAAQPRTPSAASKLHSIPRRARPPRAIARRRHKCRQHGKTQSRGHATRGVQLGDGGTHGPHNSTQSEPQSAGHSTHHTARGRQPHHLRAHAGIKRMAAEHSTRECQETTVTCTGGLNYRTRVAQARARCALRSTCGGRWRAQTRRTRPWRSTSAGRWTGRRGWSHRSRRSTCAPGGPRP